MWFPKFYEAVKEYRQISDDQARKTAAQSIYDTYVRTGTDQEINVDFDIRKSIQKKLENAPKDIFDEAYTEILSLLNMDVLPKFKQSYVILHLVYYLRIFHRNPYDRLLRKKLTLNSPRNRIEFDAPHSTSPPSHHITTSGGSRSTENEAGSTASKPTNTSSSAANHSNISPATQPISNGFSHHENHSNGTTLKNDTAEIVDGVDLAAELAPIAEKSAVDLESEMPTPKLNWYHYLRKSRDLTPIAMSMALSNVIFTMNGVILLMFTGRLGELQGASAGMANVYINVTGISFCIGLLTAQDTMCSQAFGARNFKRVSIVFQRAVVLISLIMIPVAVMWLFTEPLLLVLRQDPSVSKLAGRFVRIYLPSLPFYLLSDSLKRYLTAQSITLPALLATLAANIICSLLGFVLILHTSLGFDGMPICMGLSNLLGFVFLAAWTVYRRLHVPTWRTITKEELLDTTETLEFFKLGLPGAFMVCAEWIGFEIHGIMSGWIGVTAQAAQSILLNTNYTIFSLPLGMSVATTVLVGTEMGMGKFKDAFLSYIVAFINIEIPMLAVSILLIALHKVWGYIFTNLADVVAIVAKTLPVMAIFICSDSAAAVASGAIRGVGEQAKAAICNLIAFYVIGVPLGYYLAFPKNMGLPGLWFGLAAASYSSSFALHILLWVGDWKMWSIRAIDLAKLEELPAANAVALEEMSNPNYSDMDHNGYLDDSVKSDFDTPSNTKVVGETKYDRSVELEF